jgi:ribosome assembly protein YihI (activator of Der GTPase)
MMPVKMKRKEGTMEKNEHMIAVLRDQRDRLNDLVTALEHRELISAEDHSFCECKVDEIIKNLKSVRRFTISGMLQDILRHQLI